MGQGECLDIEEVRKIFNEDIQYIKKDLENYYRYIKEKGITLKPIRKKELNKKYDASDISI